MTFGAAGGAWNCDEQQVFLFYNLMPDLLVLVLLSGGLTVLSFGALRMLYPASSSPHQTDHSMEELQEEYHLAGLQQLGIFLLLTALGTVICYGIYQGIATLLYSGRLAKHEYLIRADLFARLLCAVVGGAAIAFRFTGPLFAHYLKDRYSGYVDYQNRKSGLANERASIGLGRLAAFSWLIIGAIFLNWYTAFGPQGIRQYPLFDYKIREYTYEQIRGLERLDSFVSPDGKTRELEHYVIHFANGEVWNSRNSGYEDPSRNADLMKWLAKKTGNNVRFAE